MRRGVRLADGIPEDLKEGRFKFEKEVVTPDSCGHSDTRITPSSFSLSAVSGSIQLHFRLNERNRHALRRCGRYG